MTQNFMQKELWDAARSGDTQRIRVLVVNGADVLMLNADGQNALHIAIQNGHESTYKTLMAASEMQKLMTSGLKKAA